MYLWRNYRKGVVPGRLSIFIARYAIKMAKSFPWVHFEFWATWRNLFNKTVKIRKNYKEPLFHQNQKQTVSTCVPFCFVNIVFFSFANFNPYFGLCHIASVTWNWVNYSQVIILHAGKIPNRPTFGPVNCLQMCLLMFISFKLSKGPTFI